MESLAGFTIQGLQAKDGQIWVERHPFTETLNCLFHVSFRTHGLESGYVSYHWYNH